MKITKVRLVKNRRLRLGMFDVFEINPTATTQFIIGTNGCGKSSLMDESSPLPADRADYAPGGSKEFHCIHEGRVYVLTSSFEDGQKHSFVCDGKELNEGGTITVQKDLVWSHFHYSNEIHQVVTGQRRFHQMGVSERKHWFTVLSDADYEYAIGVFNKLKDRARDISGAIKLAKKRLVIESSKLVPEEEFLQLQRSCEDLYKLVQFLIENRQTPEHNIEALFNEHQQCVTSIANDSKQLMRRVLNLRRGLPVTEADIAEKIADLQGSISACQTLAQRFFEEHEQVSKLHEAWQESRIASIAEIDKEINQAEQEIEKAHKSLLLKLEQHTSATTVLASCEAIENWLPSAVLGLADNRERAWGRAAFNTLNEEIQTLKVKLSGEQNKAARAQQAIDHQKAHKDDEEVKCPRCSHQFRISFDAAVLENASEALKLYQANIEELEKQIQSKEELRQQMSEYFNAYRNVITTLNTAPGMDVFCSYLVANDIILHSPQRISTLLMQFKQDAGQWAIIERAQERIEKTRKLLETTAGASDASSKDIAERKNKLDEEIAQNEQRKRELALEVEQLQRHRYELQQIDKLQSGLVELASICGRLKADADETLRRQVYNDLLRDVQSTLASKEQALRASERQQSVIAAVTQEIEELTQDEVALKVLLKELSPTEGLIAEGLFGFMKTFVSEMNKIVKIVWSYPLTVKPCSLESEDALSLTYKFPMDVGSDDVPRKDVSEGSDGMKEVVDLAFRISAMKALRIDHFPLFLDEFGKTLDPAHKQATIGLFNAIIELERFEQLFMVSHDVIQYGSLGQAEICVLHEANAQLPPDCVFNKHCIFE